MLKFQPKDHKHLYLAAKKEKKIRLYKLMLTLPGTLSKYQIHSAIWKYMLVFHMYYKPLSGISRIKNVCVFTGRTRAVYRTFQLARMKAKEFIKTGMFFGVSKSSW